MASLVERLQYVARKLVADSRWLQRADPENLEYRGTELENGIEDRTASLRRQALHALHIEGVYKLTEPGRLRETERVLCRYLKEMGGLRARFLDVGASDGSTTLDTVSALRDALGVKVEACLADRFLELHRYRLGPLVEYRTEQGLPIIARIGRVGLSVSTHRADAVAEGYGRATWLRRRLKADGGISLVDPRVFSDPDIRVHALDCLQRDTSLEDRFDAVRASNILNLCYFEPERIAVALNHLHAYLRDGGLLVVSRNVEEGSGEVEHGSIWQRCGTRFEHLADFGDGSEIRYLVDRVAREDGPDSE